MCFPCITIIGGGGVLPVALMASKIVKDRRFSGLIE
jgi:hypothetical protein